jgi:hypothetical protein
LYLRMPFGVEVPFVPGKAEVWLTIADHATG